MVRLLNINSIILLKLEKWLNFSMVRAILLFFFSSSCHYTLDSFIQSAPRSIEPSLVRCCPVRTTADERKKEMELGLCGFCTWAFHLGVIMRMRDLFIIYISVPFYRAVYACVREEERKKEREIP